MTADYVFRPDLQNRLRREFKTKVGQDFSNIPRRDMQRAISEAVERRAAQVREKLRTHQQKMKPLWAAREEQRLRRTTTMQMAHARASGPKPPYGVSNLQSSHAQSVRERAQANVDARCQSRLRKLESIERRMTRRLTRTQKRSR